MKEGPIAETNAEPFGPKRNECSTRRKSNIFHDNGNIIPHGDGDRVFSSRGAKRKFRMNEVIK